MSQPQTGQSSKRSRELAKRIPTGDIEAIAKAVLSPEEIERYEAAQRSITEAQRHAQENEGYRVIL